MIDPLAPDWIAFLEVATAGSFSKAAARLRTPQPGLSRRIRRLEDQLGARLLERTNRGVRLTQIGQGLFDSMRAQREAIRKSISTQLRKQEGPQGSFTLGCHRALGISQLPLWIPGLLVTYPQLNISFRFLETRQVMTEVRDGQLDFGLVVDPVRSADLIVRKVAEEGFGAFHRLALPSGRPELILFNPEMIQLNRFKSLLRQAHSVPVPDYDVVGAIAHRTPGAVAILPQLAAERWELRQTYPSGLVAARKKADIHIVYRRAMKGAAVTQAIARAIRESLNQA